MIALVSEVDCQEDLEVTMRPIMGLSMLLVIAASSVAPAFAESCNGQGCVHQSDNAALGIGQDPKGKPPGKGGTPPGQAKK